MKWIIVVFVNFLPETGQWEMYDYREQHFSSPVACEMFVMENKQFFIDDANRAYHRNSKDYVIKCPNLEDFNGFVADEEPQLA